VSPLTHADRIRMPLFIAHDKNDTSVPYTESEQMVAAVKKNGTPVWYLLATDQGHGLTRASSAAYLMHAWAYFMQQFLLT
jgi:dipeptidyl aminopeptidase/acylaminoacyl peptidase